MIQIGIWNMVFATFRRCIVELDGRQHVFQVIESMETCQLMAEPAYVKPFISKIPFR